MIPFILHRIASKMVLEVVCFLVGHYYKRLCDYDEDSIDNSFYTSRSIISSMSNDRRYFLSHLRRKKGGK